AREWTEEGGPPVGGMGCAVVLAAVVTTAVATTTATAPVTATPTATAEKAQERFLYLLRTYPQRPPRETLAQVEKLVDEGDFPDRDRAEYWLGSAWLSLQDREAARRWFGRVQDRKSTRLNSSH